MHRKTTLKNGLRIITVPWKSTEAVTVLVLVGTGSKYENKQNNGISHFLEHMLFKGTEKRKNKLEIAETLDKVGGIFNAFTGQDYTGYFAKVGADNFELALDWVSDIFLNSILPQSEMKREKGVITEEINMYQDHPMSYIQTLWSKLLYGDQPAGWDVLGTKENVLKMRRQDLLGYMKKQYVSKNTIVCVAGKVGHSKAIKKVEKYFSEISDSSFLTKPKVTGKQNKANCLIDYKKTDQSHLALGVPGYNLFHPLRYVQEVLGVILGGMMSSRLFMEVRERLGLAYYIKINVFADPDTGCLVTRAGVDNKNIEKAISAILKEYKKISQNKVSISELEKAKNNIKGKMALSLESSDELASFYVGQELLEKRVLTPKQIFKKIDKVSADNVLKLSRDIFKPEKLNLALIGPFKNKSKIERLLKL